MSINNLYLDFIQFQFKNRKYEWHLIDLKLESKENTRHVKRVQLEVSIGSFMKLTTKTLISRYFELEPHTKCGSTSYFVAPVVFNGVFLRGK